MSDERYFKIEYDEEWYLFDSTTISEQLVKEQAEYGYGVFANSLSPSEVVDLLNEQSSIIRRDEMSIKTMMSNMEKLEKENEDLREVNKENQLLHEENVKQCERWKNLYELKDAEVTARVDALNRVCEYYLSETRFKGDTDPNDAVKEVINEILNAPIYEE